MKHHRIVIPLVALVALMMLTATQAFASTRTVEQNGGTYIGHDAVVPSDEDVRGDVTVVGGNLDVEGRVDGDVTIVGGSLTKGDDAVISGQVNEIGNDFASFVPFMPVAAERSRIERENHRLMAWLAYSVIVLVAFLIFPVRVRAALDRVEHHPGLSAGVGVLALVAVFPVALLLFVSFIGWPLIPVEFLAVFAAILIGYAALSLLIGRRLYEMLFPRTTPSPVAALILGLVVIAAAGMVPVIGHLVIGLVCLVGLGAAILAFVRETHFMGPHFGGPQMSGPQPGAPRPPIGGPPMPA